MSGTLRSSARYVVVVTSALLALFVLSQSAQLVNLASSVHPVLGTIFAVVLLALLGWFVAVPVVGYLRLEPALIPPEAASGPAHDAFIETYLAACRRNPRLAGHALETEADLEAALRHLEKEAEQIANKTALRVFLGTAVSQYGSLDALIVALTQADMVWRIAHVFQRRPSLRHVGYLYANVLATAIAASQVDRVDLSEYLRPVLAGVLGRSVASAPVVAAASSHISNAVFQGSVNAFLTLRVAMVTIAYSRATTKPERSTVWRNALARAGSLVVRTAATGTGEITKAFAVATGKTVAGAAAGVGQAVVSGGKSVGAGVTTAGRAVGDVAGTVVKSARTLRPRSAKGTPEDPESTPEDVPGPENVTIRSSVRRLRRWKKRTVPDEERNDA